MKNEDSKLLEEYSGLFELLELQLEDRISRSEFERLEAMIRHDSTARKLYLQYIDLHGMLHYDTAAPHVAATTEAADATIPKTQPVPAEIRRQPARRQSAGIMPTVVSCLVLLALIGYFSFTGHGNQPGPVDIVEHPATGPDSIATTSDENSTGRNGRRLGPIQLPERPVRQPENRSDFNGRTIEVVYNAWEGSPVPSESSVNEAAQRVGSSDADVVAFINEQIRIAWEDNEVSPSPRAEDSEWLRRTYLDLVGHIPTAEQAREFLASEDSRKRADLINALLEDEDYVRNWTTVWTNLLIGRSNPREVDRPALKKFLRESFAKNRKWDEVVEEFIAAQGNHKENGATNFLLAHVNDQALPATATVARLFLGQQLQCLQCHNHPFNDWQQQKFWGFHGFFSQMEVVSDRSSTSLTDNGSVPEAIFYERRNGLMRATYPEFNGRKFRPEDVTEETRLRKELASIMTSGESTDVARAFVNRMWQHFFGAAFTPVVDDMGPHAVPSHPELLEGLTRAFVRSNYNVKQLIRWMTNSNAYQLSSRFNDSNEIDNPASGQMPLFSRVYVKSMSVEQTFDSLMVATRAGDALGADWDAVDRERQRVQKQFVMQWETEDNDEANLFNGSVPQALMMMNSPLIQTALDSSKGTYIGRVIRSQSSETDKIEALAMAALSRPPSSGEIAAVREMARSRSFENGQSTRLEDLFWAYLNSSEFILIH